MARKVQLVIEFADYADLDRWWSLLEHFGMATRWRQPEEWVDLSEALEAPSGVDLYVAERREGDGE